jgi:YjbE family integral membrane protein
LTEILSPEFWTGLMAIIGVNIVLSGDNAVVIALAARSLPPAQQKRAIAIGSGAAVVMRIILTIVAVELLRWPYLKLIGAGLLLWIAIGLVQPEDEEGEGGTGGGTVTMAAAIRTILIADLVMSLDNVLAVAAAATGSILLLVVGLAISIPLVIFGSTLLLKLMERWPAIITLGAALLGWVAGDMATTDPAVSDWVQAVAPWLHEVAEVIGAVFVVLAGHLLAFRELARRGAERAAAVAEGMAKVAAGAAGPLFQRVLVAVDASDNAARAVDYVINLRKQHPDLAVEVVNVQRDVSGDVSRFIARETLQGYHQEQGEQATRRAKAMLDAASIPYAVKLLTGKPWEAIAQHAVAARCDHVILGSRGLGSYTGALLGSIAQGVAGHSPVPVIIVK